MIHWLACPYSSVLKMRENFFDKSKAFRILSHWLKLREVKIAHFKFYFKHHDRVLRERSGVKHATLKSVSPSACKVWKTRHIMSSSSQSQDPTSSMLSIQSGDDDILILEEDDVVTLNYQPTIIKCKNGDHIWQANNDRTCTQMCKSQLKVSLS